MTLEPLEGDVQTKSLAEERFNHVSNKMEDAFDLITLTLTEIPWKTNQSEIDSEGTI